MKFPTKHKTVAAGIAAFLILLFVYTALTKLMDHTSFAYTLQQSPLIGPFAKPVTLLLPLAELILSLQLFMPPWREKGLLLSTLLLLFFTLYVGYMLLFTPHLPCSCGGVLQSMGWKEHLLFNMTCTAIAWGGWRAQKKSKHYQKIYAHKTGVAENLPTE